MFRVKAAAREREPDTYVPYIGHASPGVLLLDDGSLLAMIRLDGAPFETADPREVNARHAQRNILLRNLASDRLVLATHVVRSLSDGSEYPQAECVSDFARELDASYRTRLMSNRLFRNELFLSVVLRAAGSSGVTEGNIAVLFARRKRGDRSREATPANLDAIANVVATLLYELGAYGARQIELRDVNGIMFSELAETLRLVLTGEPMPVPLVNGHLGGAIYTDRVIVGREAIEIRGAGGSTFAAGFGLREYPATTWPGMFDAVLGAPYRCVLTQTFGFLNKQVAQNVMTRKQNQMLTAQDKAASQTEALTEAADLLASNAFVMGDHHLTLVTFADTLDNLRAVAARARRDLAESGAVIVREDLALEAAYWAQLPGNMKLRTRPGAISSRNFAAMASLHNYPTGAARGHWGEPVTVFRSSGGTAYRFHLHAPTETVTDVGNVFVAGPIGSGKAQPLDANVLTPMGWKKMGALAVGDLVTAPDGSFVPITGVFPQGDKPVFRVTFEDGRTVECCDEHLWKIWDCNKEAWTVRPLAEIRAILARGGHTAQRLAIPLIEPFAAELPSQDLPIPPYALGVLLGDGSFRTGHVRLTTADPEHILTRITADLPDYEAVHVSGTDFDYRFRMKHRQQMTLYGGKPSIMATVLTHEGVSFTAKQWAKDLRIDDEVISARLRREWPVPQVLGFERRAVSKGRASVARLINHDGETKTLREWAAVYGTYPQQLSQRLLWGWSMAQALGLAPRPQVSRNRSPLGEALSQLGLTAKASYEKSVPEAYKRSSVAQRLALLQGLLDTDGSVGNGTHASFTSTSERLARDVQEIAWSLGARAKLARRQTHFTGSLGEKKAGRPSWRVSIVHPDISRLFSLPRKVAQCKPKAMQHRLRIVRIEEAGVKPMRCISVGHPDQLYVTDGFVVTHNTTLVLFLLAMVERQKAQVVFFDRDRGGDILARAVGGTYLVLPSGEPSGLAPLKALTDKPADLEFLKALVKALVLEPGRDLLPEHERLLDLGVRSIMGLPPQARSFAELRAFLGQSDPEGPGAKLDKWCRGGALGWVLDNDADAVSLDAPFLGFDVTAVLDDPVTRGPILSYLFHRVESLLDGRRLVLAIDEFWKVLLDPGFRDLVNEKLKTIRKLNGLVILVTQSAADALRSPIAHSIIEQCPTQILLPNARADAADYRDGLKLTEPEYLAVREDLTVGGRRFLLKQGSASVACELDLSGLDDLVAVLSGRASTVRLMERLMAEVGPDPAAWLPHFRHQWRSASA